jgi:hypothetical protein
VKILDFESSASANSATSATSKINALQLHHLLFFHCLSTNDKQRPSLKVPHLHQYVISAHYFGKVKINGKDKANVQPLSRAVLVLTVLSMGKFQRLPRR